jgi:hypothetical protein
MAFFDCAGIRLMLAIPETDAGRADATHDLWLAEFRDSENNVLALMCENRKR